MKKSLFFCLFFIIFLGCHKDKNNSLKSCNIQKAYEDNAKKLSITTGVWGTVSCLEGDFMPKIGGAMPEGSHCPVQRTLKIYQYSLLSDGVKSGSSSIFFDSFNTQLIKQVSTDENGFFQAAIPPGRYSIVIVENGHLYAASMDRQGGISPFTVTSGTVNANLIITYKASF